LELLVQLIANVEAIAREVNILNLVFVLKEPVSKEAQIVLRMELQAQYVVLQVVQQQKVIILPVMTDIRQVVHTQKHGMINMEIRKILRVLQVVQDMNQTVGKPVQRKEELFVIQGLPVQEVILLHQTLQSAVQEVVVLMEEAVPLQIVGIAEL
jgi:hypothetical protein